MAPRKRKPTQKVEDEQTEEGSYKCNLCGQSFQRGCGLASHLRRHAPVLLNCQYCNYTCKHKYAYDRHMAQSHPEATQSGPLERVSSDDDDDDDMEMPVLELQVKEETVETEDSTPPSPTKSSYQCALCTSEFSNKPRAAHHILCHRQRSIMNAEKARPYFKKIKCLKIRGFPFTFRRPGTQQSNSFKKRTMFWRKITRRNVPMKPQNSMEVDVTPIHNTRSKGQVSKVSPLETIQEISIMVHRMRLLSGTRFGQVLNCDDTQYYLCRFCPHVSYKISNFWNHYRQHVLRSKKSWSCVSCSFKSAHISTMRRHVKLHKRDITKELEIRSWCKYEKRCCEYFAREKDANDKKPLKPRMMNAKPPVLNGILPINRTRGNRTKNLKRDIEMAAPTLQKCEPLPKLMAMERPSNKPSNAPGPVKRKTSGSSRIPEKPPTPKIPVGTPVPFALSATKTLYNLPKHCKFYRPKPEEPKPTTSAASSSSNLVPPRFVDFLHAETEYPNESQRRQAVEKFSAAKEAYQAATNAPKLKPAGIIIPYEELHPLAKEQYGRNNAREYLMREFRMEHFGECGDCPFKDTRNIHRFRRHRDRHFYSGAYSCHECTYRAFDRSDVQSHMFLDHYLSDVKRVEGISSSEYSEEDDTPPPQKQPKKKGRKRRRW